MIFKKKKKARLCYLLKQTLILDRTKISPQSVNINLVLSRYILFVHQVNSYITIKLFCLDKACKNIRNYP